MNRLRHKIVSKCGQKYTLDRQNWTTYANFNDMYNHIIKEMVNAGVAVELSDLVLRNRSGEVCNFYKDVVGYKVTDKIGEPQMCLVGDEVGGNICMKGDGNIGDELLLTARGTTPQNRPRRKIKQSHRLD
uniref:Uncharacterized protein n=1 Tax=Eucampia antarctica TaxID=49252 RepID=A0A7S2SC94_9STRA|mmetsp:Transcript_6208/g.5807  ORF Transcript_6208/g.5807 Transcript_6208/m.5807 type:complete len:130 (+) Transcript_6208:893-1282(+)